MQRETTKGKASDAHTPKAKSKGGGNKHHKQHNGAGTSEQGNIPGQMQAPALPWALRYAADGWPVAPLKYGTRQSHKSAEYSDGRKWGATTDPEEIKRDYARWPQAGVILPCGYKFWTLDTDSLAGHGVDGLAAREELQRKLRPTAIDAAA